jgi:hypothetical protein
MALRKWAEVLRGDYLVERGHSASPSGTGLSEGAYRVEREARSASPSRRIACEGGTGGDYFYRAQERSLIAEVKAVRLALIDGRRTALAIREESKSSEGGYLVERGARSASPSKDCLEGKGGIGGDYFCRAQERSLIAEVKTVRLVLIDGGARGALAIARESRGAPAKYDEDYLRRNVLLRDGLIRYSPLGW